MYRSLRGSLSDKPYGINSPCPTHLSPGGDNVLGGKGRARGGDLSYVLRPPKNPYVIPC